MLRDGLGTFKLLSALLTTILVGRHGLASINQGVRECHFTAGGNPISAVMSANVPKMDIGKPATTGRSEKSFLLMCVEMRNYPQGLRGGVDLGELIKLIVQVLEEVLEFARGEFFFCRMTAADQLLFQCIQRLNDSVLARENASIVASHAVSVIQALPVGAVARQ